MRPRILFVDDESLILSALRRMFRREDVDVTASSDPHEALTIIGGTGADVIVSDFRMPALLGTDFLRQARENGCKAITILLTGQSDASIVKRALYDGTVDVVIHKPWRDDRLRQTVLQACRLEPRRAAP